MGDGQEAGAPSGKPKQWRVEFQLWSSGEEDGYEMFVVVY